MPTRPDSAMPEIIDLRVDAGWVVPVEPVEALRDHSVLIHDGRIRAVQPTLEAALQAARSVVSRPDHVVLPGLVNAHTHAAMSLFRGIADDVPLQTWLEAHIWPREGRFAAPDFVYDGARLAAVEMLRGGITLCNDMYFFPEAAAQAFVEAGMRAMLGLPVLDFPTPYAADPDAYLQKGLSVRDALKREPRLAFSLAPHAPYTVGDPAWERVVTYARQLDLPIQTHLAETASEVEASRERFGLAPLARLHALGATGPGFIAIHGVHLGPDDIELLAVHGPASNMKLASGIAPVAARTQRGVNVALGTDGAASNNRLDLFAEMRLASLLAKVASGNPAVLGAREVLFAATLGGAQALGLEHEVGSLLPGKRADLIAVQLTSPESTPCYDPVSHLVHAVGREAVTDVWVDGRHVVDARALVTLDEDAVLARARAWQERLQ
jgi:5-methylthioadenosine/S-adenosylhomocysteine deaminase